VFAGHVDALLCAPLWLGKRRGKKWLLMCPCAGDERVCARSLALFGVKIELSPMAITSLAFHFSSLIVTELMTFMDC